MHSMKTFVQMMEVPPLRSQAPEIRRSIVIINHLRNFHDFELISIVVFGLIRCGIITKRKL